MTKSAFLVLALLLSSCREDRPPGPTEEQSAQLNDAEAMLNDAANSSANAQSSPRR